jgi:hypothetical protein
MMRKTAIGTALAVGLMLTTSTLASAQQPHPAGHAAIARTAQAAVHHTSGRGTQADVRALRHATNAFHNLDAAQKAGYGFFTDAKGIACIAMPGMGGMGVHFVNGAFVGDATENLRKPEALVYRIDKAGVLRLSAVEYVVLASAWDAANSSPPKLFGHTFSLTTSPNRYGLPDFYSLHAWVWKSNPAGQFAPYNPKVTC